MKKEAVIEPHLFSGFGMVSRGVPNRDRPQSAIFFPLGLDVVFSEIGIDGIGILGTENSRPG